MRASFAAVLAFASVVFAQTDGFAVVSKPAKGEKVPAGAPYEVQFAPNSKWSGTATVILMAGDTDKGLQLVTPPVATGVDVSKGSFEWDVASTLGDKAVYGLQITLDSDKTVYQYSFPFQIVGGSAASGSASGSTSATATDKTIASQTTLSSSIITPPSNLSTTAGSSQTTLVLTTGSGSGSNGNGNGGSSGATKTSTPAPGSTNAAAPIAGSTIALFGGLAMAVFAL
ncbi:Ser-Thr-rich glycosyl-phosphatidyl-inositol-anchored membrane family-domain-containing protein [Echria macrotheca]|uniref:Ser-Thr-rich glycosyl-phosphatidyl-inositol-anchored membrane family-domain-containing protein n=1 Tax=Echria macrotheca TaxID=438768 RepID=A0AAJ0F623_9PEZI|nr:Ser-Thr-rich glycosyl-phosphatidyl-inositol-anchored membrane family-domain-containing protein [Echria macrotheca]